MSVQGVSQRASAAASGAAFVVLDVVALLLPGAPPKASDSAREIAATLAAHRDQVLAATYISGLAVLAYLVFAATLRDWLAREQADRGLTAAALTGGALALAFQIVGFVLVYGATFKVAGDAQDALVRGLTDAGNAAIDLSKFGFAGLIGCICLAGPSHLPAPLRNAGLASALLLTLSAVPLISEDPVLEFGGPVDLLGALPGIIWLGTLSLLLARRAAGGARRTAPC